MMESWIEHSSYHKLSALQPDMDPVDSIMGYNGDEELVGYIELYPSVSCAQKIFQPVMNDEYFYCYIWTQTCADENELWRPRVNNEHMLNTRKSIPALFIANLTGKKELFIKVKRDWVDGESSLETVDPSMDSKRVLYRSSSFTIWDGRAFRFVCIYGCISISVSLANDITWQGFE